MRIFISSPSDLAPERRIVLQVVSRLAAEFKHHFQVSAVLWEHEPLLATEHFQEGLVSPAECDFVVCMLWSRLGSPLPADRFARGDSGEAMTGTEWEYHMAVDAHREAGHPQMLCYRKTAPVQVSLDDESAVARAQAAKRQVDGFFEHHFHNQDEAHTFKNAYWPFQTIDEIEALVYTHLQALLREQINQAQGATDDARVVWHQGSPFRGLHSFDFEHADIYFGRNRARNELLQQFQNQVTRSNPFLAVLGTSGSGKSSLVKAGLAPVLTTPGVVSGVAEVRWCVFKPSDGHDGVMRGLTRAIVTERCLPELLESDNDAALQTLLQRVSDSPHALETLVFAALGNIKRTAGYRDELSVKLLIVIDQFEEIFSAHGFTDDERAAFVSLLASLTHSGHSWVIATMRSDFYAHCEAVPELVELMRADGQFHLTPASGEEITQMIAMPARAAGIEFERDEDGIGLDEVLRETAAGQPAILPLLSFTLDQLFERRRGALLTHAAYAELGGVEGAITRQADRIFERLNEACRHELPALLSALVTIRGGEHETVAARRCPWNFVAEAPARSELADAFIEARLLTVTGDRHSGKATVAVAHEALLRGWARASDWIAQNLEYLHTRARLTTTARYWDLEGRAAGLLIPPGRLLAQASALLEIRRADLGEVEVQFVEASVEAERQLLRETDARARAARRGRRRTVLGITAVVVVLLSATALVLQGREAQGELRLLAAERAAQAARSRVDSFARLSLAQTAAGDPMNGIHLGIQAARQARQIDGTDGAEAALYAAVWAQPRSWPMAHPPATGSGKSVWFDGTPARVLNTANGFWQDAAVDTVAGTRLLDDARVALVKTTTGHYQLRQLKSGDSAAAPTSTIVDLGKASKGTPVPVFSANGRRLALVTEDAMISVHAVQDGQPVTTFPAPSGLRALVLSHSGSHLAVSADIGVRVHSLETGSSTTLAEPPAPAQAVLSLSTSATITDLRFGGGEDIAGKDERGAWHLWHRGDGRWLTRMADDGELRRAGQHWLSLGQGRSHAMTLWDAHGWPQATSLHRGPIAMARVHHDTVFSADSTGAIYAWRLDGALRWVQRPADAPATLDSKPGLLQVSANGGRIVAAWDSHVVVLDSADGAELSHTVLNEDLNPAVLVAGDAMILRTSAEIISVVSLEDGRERHRLRPGYEITPVAVAADGSALATRAFGQLLESWDLRTGVKQLSTIAGNQTEAFSYVGGGAYIAGRNADGVDLWLAKGNNRVLRLKTPFAVDAVAMDDSTGQMIMAGAARLAVTDADGKVLAERDLGGKRALALSTTRGLAAIAYRGGAVAVMRLPSLEVFARLNADADVEFMSFSDDRQRLLVANRRKQIISFELDGGAAVQRASHWQHVRSLQALAGGGFESTTDGAWMHWSGGPKAQLLARRDLPGRVDAMVETDGSRLAVVRLPSRETTVHDTASDQDIGRIAIARSAIKAFTSSADGRRVVTATQTGAVQLWDIGGGSGRTLGGLDESVLGLFQDKPDAVCEPVSAQQRPGTKSSCRLRRPPTRLMFSSAGDRVAASRDGQIVTVFAVQTGERLLMQRIDERLVSFSLDGEGLVLESSNGELRSLTIAANATQTSFGGRLPLRPFRSTIELRGGQELLVPYVDGKPRLDLANVWRDTTAVLDADRASARMLARTARAVVLIDAARGITLARVPVRGRIRTARFSSSARHVLVVDDDGVRVLPLYQRPIENVAAAILAGQ
jgi:WD40 repeat protein